MQDITNINITKGQYLSDTNKFRDWNVEDANLGKIHDKAVNTNQTKPINLVDETDTKNTNHSITATKTNPSHIMKKNSNVNDSNVDDIKLDVVDEIDTPNISNNPIPTNNNRNHIIQRNVIVRHYGVDDISCTRSKAAVHCSPTGINNKMGQLKLLFVYVYG